MFGHLISGHVNSGPKVAIRSGVESNAPFNPRTRGHRGSHPPVRCRLNQCPFHRIDKDVALCTCLRNHSKTVACATLRIDRRRRPCDEGACI